MCVVGGMVTRVRAEVRDLEFESHIPHIIFDLVCIFLLVLSIISVAVVIRQISILLSLKFSRKLNLVLQFLFCSHKSPKYLF
jgi:hypothetical protein